MKALKSKKYKTKKVRVSINIAEMDTLLNHHWEIYDWIHKLPQKQQDAITMAGWPLRETGQIHLRRYRELDDLKQTTWPK